MKTIILKKTLVSSFILACTFMSQISFASQNGIDAYENENLNKAKDIFIQSLEKNDKDAIALHYLGKIALTQGELDDAEDYIEKAQKYAPNNAAVFFDSGRIMGAQAQDSSMFSAPGYAKDSLKGFKKAAELEPSTVKYREGLMSFYLQAPGFLGGDKKLALIEANAIAHLDEVKGFVALANVYQSTDADKKLDAHYASAETKFADNASILFSRGMYYQSEEKFDIAVADFQKVLTLKPANDNDHSIFSAQYQIGRSSVLSKDNYEVGIKALHGYIETAPVADSLPTKAWAKYRLGLLYKGKGDKATAKKLYQQAKSETKDKTLLKGIKKALRKVR